MKKSAIALAMLIGLSANSQATTIDGDPEAGKAKSATCAACHGADGNSVITANPKIAGQNAEYLFKQLQDFKAGAMSGGSEGRANAIMGGMVAALSEQDMKDLAVFYAQQETKPGATPEEVIAQGEKLYRAGDASRGVTACTACHGPQGEGVPLAGFPKLSGQHPDYIAAQLKAFRNGSRNNDLNNMMGAIAEKLSDKDIDILSQYVSGLH
ncbi:c-type cytochrome [Catenovulum sediminis]|uniref:C-type cytochrome n=1 Tax=Catenovulum sediminis TaxID=1740262 RepID=A0ABV1RED7_9ALTE|nr:c-type cytochrome [Catenovulum sediminis]